jgi:hypothetical protein
MLKPLGDALARPYLVLIFPCAFVVLEIAFGVIMLKSPLISINSLLHFLAFVSLVVLGGILGERSPRRKKCVASSALISEEKIQNNAIWLIAAALCAGIARYSDATISGTIQNIGDYSAARESVILGNAKTSIFGYVYGLLLPAVLIGPAYSLFYFEELGAKTKGTLFTIPMAVEIFNGILYAGRYYLTIQLILVLWACVNRSLRKKSFVPGSWILIAILSFLMLSAVIGFGYIASTRSDKTDQMRFALELASELIVPNPALVYTLDKLGSTMASGAIDFLTYWPMSFAVFDKAFHDWNLAPDVSTVFSPMLARRIESIGLIPSGEVVYYEWLGLSASHGFYQGAWATVVFDIIKSFGKIGSLIIGCALGYFSGREFYFFKNSRSISDALATAWLWVFFIFIFQRSIFYEPAFEYSSFWIIGNIFWLELKGAKRINSGTFIS